MRKIDQYILKEKENYGNIYSEITYAHSELEPFIDAKILKQRKYSSCLPVLTKYMEQIDKVKSEAGREGLLGFLKDDGFINSLEDFKNQYAEELQQLGKCLACKCLKCPKECEFDTCLGCRTGGRVVSCDHESINSVFIDDFVIPLQNNDTGETSEYKVLATMQNLKANKRYILLEGVEDKNDKYVLYYYPGISGATYGEITDEAEFDSVIANYQSMEKI